jgi:hypothetical protein
MIQTIIVGIILALTAFFAVRWLVRTLKGKGGGCGCGCQGCPHAKRQNCQGCEGMKLPDISLDDK